MEKSQQQRLCIICCVSSVLVLGLDRVSLCHAGQSLLKISHEQDDSSSLKLNCSGQNMVFESDPLSFRMKLEA